MAPLKIPAGFNDTLEKMWHSSGNYNFAYTIGDMSDKDVTDVCIEIVQCEGESYGGLDDEECLDRLRPAESALRSGATVQDAVNNHLANMKAIFNRDPNAQSNGPNGTNMVVIDPLTWRDKGVTLVDYDEYRGRFRVRQCTMPWNQIQLWLMNLWIANMGFEEALSTFEQPDDNDAEHNPDARGGDPNTYRWQFGLFVRAPDDYNSAVSYRIDPETASYPLDEQYLATCTVSGVAAADLTDARIREAFPGLVGGWREHPHQMLFHANLFMIADREKLKTEGVRIVRMFWDEKLDRSVEELRDVGREARTEVVQVGLGEAIQRIRDMADEQDFAGKEEGE